MRSHLLNSVCSVSHRMAPSESLEEFAYITVLLKFVRLNALAFSVPLSQSRYLLSLLAECFKK